MEISQIYETKIGGIPLELLNVDLIKMNFRDCIRMKLENNYITQGNVLQISTLKQRQLFFLDLKDFDEVIYLLRSTKHLNNQMSVKFQKGSMFLKASLNLKQINNQILIEICGQQIELEYYFERLLKHTKQVVFNQNEQELQTI